MGWFSGTRSAKCPRCGAAVPFVISGGGVQDDLLRSSKLNVAQSRGQLCGKCMREAHISAREPTVSPPSPPISSTVVPAQIVQSSDTSPANADPQFEQSLEAAQRVAGLFGDKISQEDVEKLKIRLQEGGGDGQLGDSLAYQFKDTLRSCLWTILLMLTFFVVFAWFAS